jgi:hypothetical protein
MEKEIETETQRLIELVNELNCRLMIQWIDNLLFDIKDQRDFVEDTELDGFFEGQVSVLEDMRESLVKKPLRWEKAEPESYDLYELMAVLRGDSK